MLLQKVNLFNGNFTLVMLRGKTTHPITTFVSWRCIKWEIDKATMKFKMQIKFEMPDTFVPERHLLFWFKMVKAKRQPIYCWVHESDIAFHDIYQREYIED